MDETRLPARNSLRPAHLAEVLARKAGGDHIAFRKREQVTDVGREFDPWKSLREHATCGRIGLAQKRCMMAGTAKPFFETTDPSEQPNDRHGGSSN